MAQFFNRLFREGLFTEKNLIMKNDEGVQLMTNSRVFFTFGYSSFHNYACGQYQDTNKKVSYQAVGTVRSKTGADPAFAVGGGPESYWTATYITKSAKNKDRLIRFMEYLYSDEGQIDAAWGKEGVTYEKAPTGFLRGTEAYKKESDVDYAAAQKKYGLNMFMLRDNWFVQSLDNWYHEPYEEKNLADQLYVDLFAASQPYAYLNGISFGDYIQPAAGTEESDIYTKIDLYLNQQAVKIITAKTPEICDALWNETLAKAETLGLKKLEEYQNNKLHEAKKYLNTDFIYPKNKK